MKTKLLTYMTIMCSTLYSTDDQSASLEKPITTHKVPKLEPVHESASANVTVINVAGETIFDGLVAPGQTVDELVETLYGLTHNLYDLALGEQKLLPETNLGDLGNVTLTAVAYDEIGRICGFIEEMLEKIERPSPHYVFISKDGTIRLQKSTSIIACKAHPPLSYRRDSGMRICFGHGTIAPLGEAGDGNTDATEITKAVRAEIMQIVSSHQSILGFSVRKAQIDFELRNCDDGWGHNARYPCMADRETFITDALAGIKLILELVNRPSSVSAQ